MMGVIHFSIRTHMEEIEKLRLEVEGLRTENALLRGFIGKSPASYTEDRKVRFMQWNLHDLTMGGDVQGALWEERRLNIVNTILFYKPDVVAIEEVKAGDCGQEAFNQIKERLEPHGYAGACSEPVSEGRRGERVGLIWRTRLAPPDEGRGGRPERPEADGGPPL